jgi:putative glycosyltransferase (TIGR04372 family)
MQDAFYDLVVVDTMMDIRNVYGFDRTVPLRIPPDRADALHRQLIGAGLDPTRWYATMHYRTASYGHKLNRSPIRNSDPENYRQLADYIIDELGGQVIQLGHPEMQAFPPRRGFVDLSRIANAFLLQAYAVSRSRFLIAGPSGPIGIGWSFHVPTALVDATDSLNGWGDGRHLLLTHEVTTPEGQALRNRALYDAGLLDYVVLKQKLKAGLNYRIRKSSPGELAEAARALFERTSDVQGLRALPQHHGGPKPNQLVWPPQPRISPRFLGE